MKPIKHAATRQSQDRAVQYNIGRAAEITGVSAKMIRHYESIGLIPKAGRSTSNYRTYTDNDIHTLRFIQRARGLGFSIRQIATLVSLWRNRSRSSANVRRLALEHVEELQTKIAAMQAMARTLDDLARSCHGDARPDCPSLMISPGLLGAHRSRRSDHEIPMLLTCNSSSPRRGYQYAHRSRALRLFTIPYPPSPIPFWSLHLPHAS